MKKAKGLMLVLASDNEIYGGKTKYRDMEQIQVKDGKVALTLPPFSGMYFKVI